MSNAVKNATFTTMVEGVLTDLMLKTTAAQVEVSEGVTLADKIQTILTAIDGKAATSHTHATADVTGLDDKLATLATTDAMNTAISAAIDELIDGAPDTYDTLKEIATYISEHEEVATALNEAIGKKADADTVTTLQELVNSIKTSVDGLGALASKDKVSADDLDETLAAEVTKIANKAEASDVEALQKKAHTHSNKKILDGFDNGMDGMITTADDILCQMTNKCIGLDIYEQSPVDNIVFKSVKKSLRNGNGLSYSTNGVSSNYGEAGGFVATASMLYSLSEDVDTKVAEVAAQSKTYISATQPEGLKNGDLWINITE